MSGNKEKAIGQMKLALNEPSMQRYLKELRRYGHEHHVEILMDIFNQVAEQAFDRGSGNEYPFKIRIGKW